MKTRALIFFLLSLACYGQAPIRTVRTLAELDAWYPSANLPLMQVLDFPDGPKTFRYDPTNSLPTNAIRRATITGSGRWVHDWDGSVTAFGAVPGNHFEWVRYKIGASEPPDCSDAIQAALDYASARPFGRVYFPGGDYRVDKTIYLRAPYGVIIEGVGGSPATLEAVTKGNIVQATRSDLIRNFANGPLFWVIGSTNTTTDPAFTNLQAGVTFNNYVEKIGFRDRYTTASSGYSGYAFTNTSPLVQFNASVRNHWKWVRFGTAHASHLELFRPDDTHFVECYFDSAGALTNTYSTILWGRYEGDSFYGLNQVFFRACTWETSFGGNVACIGNPGYIVGITIDGMFKTPYGRSSRPALPNLYMKKVQDAKIDLFISGATSFETPMTPIHYTNVIHIDESHNLQMRLNVQNIADGVKATLQDFIYMTNSYASLIDLGTWSSQSRLLGDWVKLDDSCYDIDVRSVGRINQYGSRTINRPHQFRAMRLIDNGQTWSAGSTNTDAVAITTMPALVGTQDYFYYARVKMPDAAPTTNKYIGGLANILTNQLGGASSTRFYITPSGDMILRQAGTNFSVNTAQTGSYSLWDAFKGEWVDLVFARQSGTNLILWANGRRTLTGSANYAENLSGELFLHFADDIAGTSESQWNYPLAESMLCLGSIDGEKVARLPIDGPPSGTTPLFWYKWGQSPVVEDLTTNKAHAYPYNGVSGSGGRHAPLLSLSKSNRGRIASPPDGFTVYQTDSTNAGPRWYSTAATNWVTASGTPDP